jgi:hypothetical protein
MGSIIVLLIVETSVASAIRLGAVNPGHLQRIPSGAGDTNTEWLPVAAQPKQCQLQNKEHKSNKQPLIEWELLAKRSQLNSGSDLDFLH